MIKKGCCRQCAQNRIESFCANITDEKKIKFRIQDKNRKKEFLANLGE